MPSQLPAICFDLVLALRTKLRVRVREASAVIVDPVEAPIVAHQLLAVEHLLEVVEPLFNFRNAEVVDRESLAAKETLRLPLDLFTLSEERARVVSSGFN